MRCIRPIKAGFDRNGDITYSSRKRDPAIAPFEFECRKCLPCRLNGAREKAIRCYHEAQMHENNIFLTLTYDDDHLESPWLIYSHFQTFMKDLRDKIGYEPENRISCMVTGEYGELNKRPHWHALIFNYRPKDAKHKYTSDRGDEVFSSKIIDGIWSRGATEFGSITLDSANYVARYAAKKLVHGKDQNHNFHPIHKTSSRNAIGRLWISKYWKQTFAHGYVHLPNGQKAGIPRYYVDWLKKNFPTSWERYVTEVRPKIQLEAELREARELELYIANRNESPHALTRNNINLIILEAKFQQLQKGLKL